MDAPSWAMMGDVPGRAEGDGDGLPSGTVTFLLTDVEGSTRLWERAPGRAEVVVPRHREIIGAAVEAHGGRRPLEQGEGDNVVAAFARATDAVRAAHAAQVALGAEPWPPDAEVRVRMAVHTGEVEAHDDGTYAGPALNRCARLRSLAHGSQVVVSSTTADLVTDDLDDGVRLVDLGQHRLRDLSRPEQVWELRGPGLDGLHPPLRSLDALPHNLPVEMSSFVGRGDEVSQGERLLGEARLLTLTGAGGCGKTRLALRIAGEAAAARTGGTWWVELAPLRDEALVPAAVAGAMGVRVAGDQDPIDVGAAHGGDHPTLVVLDNCEHLVATAATTADRLLRSCPGLTVLATSREPLGVEGEVTWRVPSLAVPPASPIAGDPQPVALATYDAVRLFIDRAVQVRPRFVVDNANAPAVAQICQRLDGIPLAIELAAARVRSLPPERIARELDDRFRLLAGGSRSALPRQQTLEASVAWSHDLLDPDERTLLRRLAVFAGSFDLDAAEEVASAAPLDPYGVLDLLDRLVDKSLVQADDPSGRFSLLETIRQYGLQRLDATEEEPSLRDRHLAWALALAQRHEEGVSWTRPHDIEALEAVRADLRAAIEWAVVARPDDGLRLVAALGVFWAGRGHYAEGRAMIDVALAAPPSDPTLGARAVWASAYVRFYYDDVLAALDLAGRGLEEARANGDQATAARCGHMIGTALLLDDPPAAREALTAAAEGARASGDAWCEADALQMRAYTYLVQGRLTEAAPALVEAITLARTHGGSFQEAWHQIGLATLAAQRGDLAEAERTGREGARLGAAIGDPAVEGFAVTLWATTMLTLGRRDEAAAEVARLAGRDVAWGVLVETRLAAVAGALGAPDREPSERGDEVAAVARACMEGGLAEEAAIAWPMAAAAALDAGRWDTAVAWAGEARALTAFAIARAQATTTLAAAERARAGDDRRRVAPRAEELGHEALALVLAEGYRMELPGVLTVLGGAAVDTGAAAEGVRLLAAAEALGAPMGRIPPTAERDAVARDVATARDLLGDDAFAAAWSEGAALTADEVIAYARRARGERGRPAFGWDSLTPTEGQVVALAAEGLTNPQIAERLLMGRETVKSHLGHVFTKLGVANRTELARAVAARER